MQLYSSIILSKYKKNMDTVISFLIDIILLGFLVVYSFPTRKSKPYNPNLTSILNFLFII